MRRQLVLAALFVFLAVPVVASEYCYKKVIDCKNLTRAACSDAVLSSLGHNGSFHLKATTPTDTVNGHVTIVWADPPGITKVCITLYDQDELANSQHSSTFKKHANPPSPIKMQSDLEKLVIP